MAFGKKGNGGSKDSYDKGDSKGGMRLRRPKKKICSFCVDKIYAIDYKDINKVKKFLSERGKILPKRISGNCAKHQRMLTEAVKRARHVALLPYTSET